MQSSLYQSENSEMTKSTFTVLSELETSTMVPKSPSKTSRRKRKVAPVALSPSKKLNGAPTGNAPVRRVSGKQKRKLTQGKCADTAVNVSFATATSHTLTTRSESESWLPCKRRQGGREPQGLGNA